MPKMMAPPPDAELRDHFVDFGDGLSAQIIAKKQIIDDGVKKWVFVLNPNAIMISERGLQEEIKQDPYGFIYREYEAVNVCPVRETPTLTRIRIDTDLDDEETPYGRRNADLKAEVTHLTKLNHTFEGIIFTLQEKLKKTSMQVEQMVAMQARIVEAYKGKKKEEESEGEEEGEE